MGILTKEVEVKPSGKMIYYYKDKGYDAKYHIPLLVKVDDLPKKSDIKINALCDRCGNKTNIRYIDYNNNITRNNGQYYCNECRMENAIKTNIRNHDGKHYFQTDEFKIKRKEACELKYGCSDFSKSEEIQKKRKQTNLIRYNCEIPSQSKEIREKMENTLLSRYGVKIPSQSEEIKQKMRLTMLERYGVENPMHSPEIRAKLNETLCKNGTQKTSQQQLYLHSLYGGELNYSISYYAADICFPEEKIICEYDGGGHRLRVTLGCLTEEEFNQKEIARDKFLKSQGYRIMRITSTTDLLPSDTTLLQLLSYARKYFSEYPNHSWINFSIDTFLVFCVENKEGIFFNYGDLHRLKQPA